MDYSTSLVAVTSMLSIIMSVPVPAITPHTYRDRDKATGQHHCYYNKKCKANQHKFFHFHSPFLLDVWGPQLPMLDI